MGICTYCGDAAGFLRTKHAECEQMYVRNQSVIATGRNYIIAEALRSITSSVPFATLESAVSEIESRYDVPSGERRTLYAEAWGRSVDQFLEDGLLDDTEEARLVEFRNHFDLT